LRKAFDIQIYLPVEVLGGKRTVSDGVGYNWINQLIEYCASQVTDEQLAGAIWNFRTIRQSLKRRIFTDLSLISTIRKLVRHKR
jgi:hypothetical protein